MRDFDIGGRAWIDQFSFSFPIAGRLSQRHLFPPDMKVGEITPPSQLSDASGARFRERAAKPGRKNAQLFRGEAMGQVQAGCLVPPSELSPDGRPLTWRSGDFNISFRHWVSQQEKLRDCDDLEHSMTNLACVVATPIQLVSWGHLSQSAQLMAVNEGGWVLFKADHQSAHRQLPIRPVDMKTAIAPYDIPPKGSGSDMWLVP